MKKNSTVDPDVHVNMVRFDSIILSLDTDIQASTILGLYSQYPAMSAVYFQQVMALPEDHQLIADHLTQLLSDTSFLKIGEDVQRVYPHFHNVSPRIDQLIQNYSSAFGITELPTIYTFLSGFVYQCFLFNDNSKNGIGIGLDMFLGPDFPYNQLLRGNPGFSQYLSKTYTPQFIPRKMAEVLVDDHLPALNDNDFLSMIIYGGKKLYAIDELLNFEEDHIIMEYDAAQMEWCRSNEAHIWQYFYDHDLFYETDYRRIAKLVAPAPHATGMPPEAPGNVGNYMGWQIVKSYMNKHPGLSLSELFDLDNAQYILENSGFKPSRS